MKFTDEQQYIYDNCLKGNFYINAGPGSGKSTILSYICEKILLDDPDNRVLLVTFTNKAAKSIKDKCVNSDQNKIIGGTFHSLSYRFLRENNIHNFICDDSKKSLIIKKVFGCSSDRDRFDTLYDHISSAKSKWPLDQDDNTLNRYNNELLKYNLVDFDDLIYLGITSPAGACFKLPYFTHILVDELQDTSEPELQLLKTWQDKNKCNMIGVGDSDQMLYMWRGSKRENVENFIKYFNCYIYNMGVNFRSTNNIVDCSSNLIRNNKKRIDKKLKAFNTKYEGIIDINKSTDPLSEIDFIINKCRFHRNRDIAILYRNRLYKNHLEFELRKYNIDYCINDSLEITDRSAVKVIISILKICSNQFDIYDLQQAAKALKGLGNTTVNKIEKETTEQQLTAKQVYMKYCLDEKKNKRLKSIIELQEFFAAHTGSNLEVMVRQIEKYFIKSFDYQKDMRNFIIDISKEFSMTKESIRILNNELGLNGNDKKDNLDTRVQLSTIHGFKGLERDIVILPWCNLYDKQQGKHYDIESERCAFYVGITRAEKGLYISYSKSIPTFVKELKL